MTEKTNRGPGAAADNRAALIAAAREVFSDQGAHAPLSAMARRAGVSQAVLYRHFPTREAIALAVFDANMTQIEALAVDPRSTLRDITDLITHQIEGSAAVIGHFASQDDAAPRLALESRLQHALEPALHRAIAAGDIDPDATLEDLVLAVGTIAALVMTAPPSERHERATAGWALLLRGLAPRHG